METDSVEPASDMRCVTGSPNSSEPRRGDDMNEPIDFTKAGGVDLVAPELIQADYRGHKVQLDRPFSYVRERVMEGRIVIVKNAFSPDLMLRLRRALIEWSQTHPPYPEGKSPNSTPADNYHRVDDGIIRSALPHIFHQFGLNTIDRLEPFLREPANLVAQAMLDVENEVAETHFDLSLTGLRLKVLHYPTGGGFLEQHTHPLEPQRVGLVLSASKLDTDVATGGTYFVSPFGRVEVATYHDIGDLILFRYDIPHGVSSVDEYRPLDWQSEAGKWSVVLDLRETHVQSGKPSGGK